MDYLNTYIYTYIGIQAKRHVVNIMENNHTYTEKLLKENKI